LLGLGEKGRRSGVGPSPATTAIFRTAKAILETLPIYHQSKEAIAGHLFCAFLALVLRKALDERLAAAGLDLKWADVARDLDRVEQVTVDQDNKPLRTAEVAARPYLRRSSAARQA
jgi:hypothetical protein